MRGTVFGANVSELSERRRRSEREGRVESGEGRGGGRERRGAGGEVIQTRGLLLLTNKRREYKL